MQTLSRSHVIAHMTQGPEPEAARQAIEQALASLGWQDKQAFTEPEVRALLDALQREMLRLMEQAMPAVEAFAAQTEQELAQKQAQLAAEKAD